jgi:hypothetical protein
MKNEEFLCNCPVWKISITRKKQYQPVWRKNYKHKLSTLQTKVPTTTKQNFVNGPVLSYSCDANSILKYSLCNKFLCVCVCVCCVYVHALYTLMHMQVHARAHTHTPTHTFKKLGLWIPHTNSTTKMAYAYKFDTQTSDVKTWYI